jgi:5-(aminomethyl)-3-furanmethanol phosphate kinase
VDATVIKVGGSLALNPEKLKILCLTLSDISQKQRLIMVPGGGEFADTVRALDERFDLSVQFSHQMAILAMDQYGYLLSNLVGNSCLVDKLENVKKVLDSGKLPIFLSSSYFAGADPLPNSWDITSDSIAVHVAGQLSACRIVLITDVDGIFTKDPRKFADAKLISIISAKELESFEERTSVDKYLPKLLAETKIECYVINGLYPERVEDIFDHKKTICTLII